MNSDVETDIQGDEVRTSKRELFIWNRVKEVGDKIKNVWRGADYLWVYWVCKRFDFILDDMESH